MSNQQSRPISAAANHPFFTMASPRGFRMKQTLSSLSYANRSASRRFCWRRVKLPVDGRVLVKPKVASITTNLIILTSRHTYHLTLKSSGKYMPRIAFYYPKEIITAEANRKSELERKAREAATPAPLAKLNFAYTVSGPDVPWKPVQTFDDGERVYIEMPQTLMASDAPTLMVNADGAEALVNYQVKGRYYIVDRLFKQAVLVSGTGKEQQRIAIARTGA